MFNHRLHKNQDFLKEFIEVNDLNDDDDNIHFRCNFAIKSEHYETCIDCEAIITFNNLKPENVVMINCDLDADVYPITFSVTSQEMDVDYGILSIYAKHRIIGLYRAVITPFGKIKTI